MRTITKLQTLLVLFLTTAMVCFMGCKDDDKDVPTPDGGDKTAASYAISGTVLDTDNAPISGVSVSLSGAQSLTATTASDGTYSFDLKTTPGAYKVAFKAEGYADRSYDVNVKSIETGVGQYIVNAVMVKGSTPKPEPEKEYKKAKYHLAVSVVDESGKAITASNLSVVVKLGDKVVAKSKEASFEVADVTPGIYDIGAVAYGYDKAIAKALVSAVPDQEKEAGEAETFDVKYPAVLLMKVTTNPNPDPTPDPDPTPTPDPTPNPDPTPDPDPVDPTQKTYIVEGIAKAIKPGASELSEVTNATWTLSCNDDNTFETITYRGATFKQEIDAKYVGKTFAIKVEATNYKSYSNSFAFKAISAGTSKVNILAVLESVGDGGSADVDFSKYGKVVPKEEAETAIGGATPKGDGTSDIKITDPNTGETKTVNVPTKALEEYTSKGITPEIKVIPAAQVIEMAAEMKEIASTTSEGVAQVDNIVFPKEDLVVIMPQGSNQNLAIDRDMATEALSNESSASSTASADRVYKGTPSGTIFSPALQITFDAPADLVGSALPLAMMYGADDATSLSIDATATLVTIENTLATMTINHFSKFAAGFEFLCIKTDSTTASHKEVNKVQGFYADKATVIPVTVTFDNTYIKEIEAMIGNSSLVDDKAKTAVYNRILNRLYSDGFDKTTKGSIALDVPVEADNTVESILLQKYYVEKAYEFKFMEKGKTTPTVITFKAKRMYAVDAKAASKQSHGHGHGNGNNAGGGIIIPD